MQRAVSVIVALALGSLVAAAPAFGKTRLPSRSFVKLTKVDLVDVGPAGDSVGDMIVFTFQVFNHVGGRRIGAGHGYCVRTEVGVANDCLANSSLPGGRIVMQWEEHDGQRVSRATITGGTGRYLGATGQLRLTSLSPTEVSAGG